MQQRRFQWHAGELESEWVRVTRTGRAWSGRRMRERVCGGRVREGERERGSERVRREGGREGRVGGA